MESSSTIAQLTDQYAAGNYGQNRPPVVLCQGRDVWVRDLQGRVYLDLFGSYAVLNFGHCHPRLVKVAQAQLSKLPVLSRSLYNEPFATFCRELAQFCGMEKVLPAVDGAGAVERAIKIVRRWGRASKKLRSDEVPTIISFFNNFHGRTYGPLSMSVSTHKKRDFGPFLDGFRYIRFGDVEMLERNLKHIFRRCAVAVFVEPIQGEGGVIVPPNGYLKEVRRICSENNILMVADEIQTGLGRTGYDLACQYEDVKPDIVLVSKALGGGLVPISAVVTTEEIMSVIGPDDDGSTFGGYPLGCAVAVEALKVLREEKLSERARELGAYFTDSLRAFRDGRVFEVRGRGLMIGIEMADETVAQKVQLQLMEDGVLVGVSHGVLRINPPLTISKQAIDLALPKIEKNLASFS